MVSSCAFIIFCFGGGEFLDSSVQLSVINAKFSNTGFLIAAAWIVLFWCMYRYWLEFAGIFRKSIYTEMCKVTPGRMFRWYIEKRIGTPLAKDKQMGMRIVELRKNQDGRWCAIVKQTSGKGNDKITGEITYRYEETTAQEIKLRTPWRKTLMFTIWIRACYQYPSFSTYAVPPILWITAVYGGLSRIGAPQ